MANTGMINPSKIVRNVLVDLGILIFGSLILLQILSPNDFPIPVPNPMQIADNRVNTVIQIVCSFIIAKNVFLFARGFCQGFKEAIRKKHLTV